MNDRKRPIHTTLSAEALRILERYEKEPEMGCKNVVLEKALLGMNKTAMETILKLEDRISKIKIEILHPFLGGIAEGSVFAIIGPPASGKTLLACAIVNDFLSSVEKQCVFVSSRNKLSYIIPITNSLGMNLEKYVENLFLNICDINALDGIFRMVRQSKPKIIVIDDLMSIQENGVSNYDTVLRSSGWKILCEEIKEQKTVCIVISEDKNIVRFCDVAIELEKTKYDSEKDITTVRVAKNIGLIPSMKYMLEIGDKVEIVPIIPAQEIEVVNTTLKTAEPGSFESLKEIADETFLAAEPKQKIDLAEQSKSSKEISKFNLELHTADKGIIKILQENGGRISRKELAKMYGAMESSVNNRLVELKKKGVVNTIEEKNGENKNVFVFLTELGSSLDLDIASASVDIQKIKQEKLEIRQRTATPKIIALAENQNNSMGELLSHQLTQEQLDAMAQIGFNLYGVKILRLIIERPCITQVVLSRELNVSRSFINKYITGFFEEGLVEKKRIDIKRNLSLLPKAEVIKQKLSLLIETGLLPL